MAMAFHNEGGYRALLAASSDSHVFSLDLGPSSSSRPRLSFLLGTCIVVVTVLAFTALFSCLYHWLRMRNQQATEAGQGEQGEGDEEDCVRVDIYDASKKLEPLPCPPVVYMPGDGEVPTFIAWPRPLVSSQPNTAISTLVEQEL